jgi:glycosyltransferase involved in cell wall biosynthesis
MREGEIQRLVRISTDPMSLKYLLPGQLAYLNQRYQVIGISSPGQYLTDVQRRENIPTIPIQMSRRIDLLYDIISLYKMIKCLHALKPSIVHSITPKAGLLAMMASYLTKVPVRIHTFTGLVFPSRYGLDYMTLKICDKILCYCATKIIPEGKGVRNDLIMHRVTSKPLTVLLNGNVNGIDTNYYSSSKFSENDKNKIRYKHNIQKSEFVFVFIGRLVKEKGLNELIAAFESLYKLEVKCRLLLAGSFEDHLDPVSARTQHVIKKHPGIIHLGFVEDVRWVLAISDCLVLPSYREGFPNVPLQAGAMSVPSIVTDVNGSNEIIRDGYNGLIVPKGSTEELLTAMKKLQNLKPFYLKLKTNSRNSIVSRYNNKLLWAEITRFYKNELENQWHIQ